MLPGEPSPLFAACLAGAEESVRLLLEHGARTDEALTVLNTDLGHFEGATALHAAVERRCAPIVKLLLDHGARPDTPDDEGFTPLHSAVGWGDERIAGLLLEAGANPNCAAGLSASTPLMEAAARGRWTLAALLMRHGADRAVTDAEGRTARDLAILEDHTPPPDL
jgi:ankyrin repeat protein